MFPVLSPNAQTVFCSRRYPIFDNAYDVCNHCGQRHETPLELFERVSFGNNTWYELMANLDFMPNSPTLFNANVPNQSGTLSACFKFDVQDSLLGEGSIMDVASKAAAVLKYGGGVGYTLSAIRPKDSPIASTHGKACGPVACMKWLFHGVAMLITQGGKREAAQMGILSVDHPDIREFIHCKDKDSIPCPCDYCQDNPRKGLSTFNISVAMTDAFMEKAARAYGTASIASTSDFEALSLLQEMAESAWKTGDPGCYFIDRSEKANPTPWLGKLTGTNPCVTGDTWVLTYAGPRRVKDLVSVFVDVIADGQVHSMLSNGFWSTGIQPVYELVVSTGQSLRLTAGHEVMTPDGWKQAGDLAVGDEVVLHDHKDVIWDGMGFYDDGVTSGYFIGRTMRNFKTAQHRIHADIEEGSSDFHVGFLRGLFDAGGYVDIDDTNLVSLRMEFAHTEDVRATQRMLARLGIYSTIAFHSVYIDEELSWHCLSINGESLRTFSGRIGFSDSAMRDNLLGAILHFSSTSSSSFVKVVKFSYVGDEEVFDVSVADIHAFDANGLYVSNCGEVPLLDNEPCNLGSINLVNFIGRDPEKSINYFDFSRLRTVAGEATRFLDFILDQNQFPHETVTKRALQTRKLGLGVMGWADTLALLKIDYDSEAAVELAAQVMREIQTAAHKASELLADEKGAFPGAYSRQDVIHLEPIEAKAKIKELGLWRHNATLTCIAPTGSISQLVGRSDGIEPHYSLGHTRTLGESAGSIKLNEGISVADALEDFVPHTAHDIHFSWHIRHQATFQEYTDLAVSKTINLPETATTEDILDAYILSWASGCKGITIYRNNSRQIQVLQTEGRKPDTFEAEPVVLRRKALPQDVPSKRHKVRIGGTQVYIHTGWYPDSNELGEVFLNGGGPEGTTLSGLLDSLAIVISLALQHGVPLGVICDRLVNRDFEPSGITSNVDIPKVRSIVDYVARYLMSEYGVQDISKKEQSLKVSFSGLMCGGCGGLSIKQGGCEVCADGCGWTSC